MKQLSVLIVILVALGLATACHASMPAPAKSAAELYQQAGALLEEARFDEALKAYAAAAKAAPEEIAYRQQHGLVRRVMRLREYYPKEENPDRRELVAAALRSFYYDNRVFAEALALDEQRHQTMQTADSAALLAETRLELGMNKEASDGLAGLDEDLHTPRTRVLLAIALARQGLVEPAGAIADTVGEPEKDDPGLYFEMACMYCLLGDVNASSDLLTKCFQSTLPSRLDRMRDKATHRADLKGLETAGMMKDLLAVKSAVSESSCSGGTSCAGCPSRGTCGTGSAGEAGTESDKK